MTITIQPERPDTADAMTLINELTAYLTPLSPPESQHGYSVEKLIEAGVQFYVVRVDGEPAACSGVQRFDAEPPYGELKRMYVRPSHRGLGLAKQMIQVIEGYLKEQDVHILRLETGIAQTEAIALYKKSGFLARTPFGAYWDDPNSLYFEKILG